MTPLSTLEVDDVSVVFGGLRALDGISLRVVPGELHAVIGPNGAGKSTLFNVISGIYRPTDGEVRLGDVVLTELPPHRICELGVARCFQNIGLFPDVSVLDNLLIGRHHLMSTGFVSGMLRTSSVRREEDSHRAEAIRIAEFLRVDHLLQLRVDDLPYGDRKRVEIARAVAMEPNLLMLDEPVAGMNRAETREISAALEDIRAELDTSILLVEHDMDFVMHVADRVTVLNFGRQLASGSPTEIQGDAAVIEAYLGQEIEAGDATVNEGTGVRRG